jgi:hypothetical protein
MREVVDEDCNLLSFFEPTAKSEKPRRSGTGVRAGLTRLAVDARSAEVARDAAVSGSTAFR